MLYLGLVARYAAGHAFLVLGAAAWASPTASRIMPDLMARRLTIRISIVDENG